MYDFFSMLKPFLLLLLAVIVAGNGHSQSRSLDYYLSTASKNSPLLLDFENQLHSGSVDSLLSLCSYKPQVNLTSQALFAPAGKNIGYDEAITNGGNYAALIGVKQSLFNDKVRSVQLENINLLKQSLVVNKMISLTELKKSITLQYITAYAGYEQMQFNLRMIEMLTEQQKAARYLVEAGIYLQTDLMNLAVSKTAMEIANKQTNIQYRNDIAILNLLSGIVDTARVELEKPTLELSNPFNLQQSPVMLQFTIDSLKNSIARKSIDLNYRPKLEAFADAGFMAVNPLNIPFNFGTSFGLNFSVPIYDGKQRSLEMNKIQIAEDSRLRYREFYTSQYRQQYLQLNQQLHLNDELVSDINRQLSQQKELIELYKAEMEKGLVRFSDFLLAINNYASTQNSLALAEMNRMQLINQLNYLK